MKEKRLLGEERMTVGLLNEMKIRSGKPPLLFVSSETLIAETLDLMDRHSISQLPVIDEGRSVGSIREQHIMAQIIDDRDLLQQPVSSVMDLSFPVVNEAVEVNRAKSFLKEAPAILIEEYGRIIGLLTRYDVLDIS
jgi:cystathionine beta-synthase